MRAGGTTKEKRMEGAATVSVLAAAQTTELKCFIGLDKMTSLAFFFSRLSENLLPGLRIGRHQLPLHRMERIFKLMAVQNRFEEED